MANRTNILIAVLVLVIVVLAGIMVYYFVIQPRISGYTAQRQVEGAQLLYLDIVKVVTQCQVYPLPVGNQTLHLVATECLQAPTQPAQ